MRFNNEINIAYVVYNEFGEALPQDIKPLKCAILAYNKVNDTNATHGHYQYDLELMFPARSFKPYTDVFENDDVVVMYDGRRFIPKNIMPINNFRGQSVYFEVKADDERNEL